MTHTERLMAIDPTDPVVVLSFAELALDTPDDRALMDRVVRATAHVDNATPVDTRRYCFIEAARWLHWACRCGD